MYVLTDKAVLVCEHDTGLARVPATQRLVRIDGRQVLIKPDPVGKTIKGCANSNPPAGIKPCTKTLAVRQGYSGLIRIDGVAICLDTVKGLTDGTPPGLIEYRVHIPGQSLVSEK